MPILLKNLILCFLFLGTSAFLGGESAIAQTVIPQSGWTLHYVDSEEIVGEDGAATNAFDGQPLTLWHTQWSGNPDPPHPHDLQVDLGAVYQVDGIRYLPRQDGGSNGRIGQYEVYVATDSGTPPTTPPILSQWTLVASGAFPNSAAEQEVLFNGMTSRYVWLRALSEAPGVKPFTTVGELNVLGTLSSGVGITPATATVTVLGQQDFDGVGGVPPYTFNVVADTSGGASVNATSGLYTAGPNAGTSTVRVTDDNLDTADALVTVQGGGGPSLSITPTAATVTVLGQQDFNGVGGVPPYTFNVVADTSGGASVNATSGLYTAGPNAGTSTVRVTDDNLDTADALVTVQGGGGSGLIDQSGWTLHYVDSEEIVGEDGAATNAFDGQPLTLWHTQWSGNPDPPHPHDLQVDLGAVYQVDGIRYLPRQDGGSNGRIGQYEVYVATDSGTPPTTPPILSQWTLVASGAFPNSAAEQEVLFNGMTSRYVWLRALSEAPGVKPFTTVGELNVLGTLSSGVGITPATATVTVLGQQDFDGVGGVPPYTFNVVADTSGGASVNATSGLYTAGPNAGTSTVRVTDDNLDTADALVTVQGGGPSNQAPSVSAGPDQTSTLPNDAILNGTVTDDGLPSPPGSVTTMWSKVSGPGTVTFGNASAVDTTASFSVDGVYVLRLTANDSALTGSDTLTIMVNPEGGGSGGEVNISNLTPVSYEVVPAPPGVQVGGLIYIDRNRTFTSIPASVQGATYIQTANNDKAATANPFLSFTVDQPVTVYVARDERLALPAWLTNMGFTDTGENLVSSSTLFDLFAQTFPAGPITLGGNESGGCCMMYSVIVKAASGGAPLTITPATATVTVLGQQDFDGVGGVPPYTFNVVADTSGGASVNATSGLYTAGPNAGTSTVRVTDDNLDTADALVTVQGGGGPSLSITPTAATVTVLGQQDFNGVGGVPPYTFNVVADTSGGASVNATSGLYTAGPNAGTSTVRVTDDNLDTADALVTVQGGGGSGLIDQSGWTLHYVDSEEIVGEDGAATNAFDGQPLTLWHTQWSGNPDPPHPHDLQVDLGAVYQVDGIRYLPRQDGGSNGRIGQYEVYVATDSGTPPTTPPILSQWTLVASGAFPNSAAEQEVLFNGMTSRYVWLRALSEAPGVKPFTTVGELNVLGTLSSGVGITPATATVTVLGQQDFDGVGGVPPYTFNVVADTSGGASVNATSGLYTAGPNAGTSTVRVTDDNLDTADALVTVQGGGGPSLSITPTAATVTVLGQQDFNGVGGVPPYTFNVVADTSGGASVNATSGLYTAGPNAGTSTVRVTDDNLDTADALVTVQGGGGPSLSITPTAATVTVLGQQDFNGVGGVPPYTFNVVADTSGGASVNATSGLYTAGPNAGTSTVRVTDDNLDTVDAGITVFTNASLVPQSGWTVHFVDSQEAGSPAANAFDGTSSTKWRTQNGVSFPHDLQVNLGNVFELEGFRIIAQTPIEKHAISFFEFYVSEDGVSWGPPVASGELSKDFSEMEVNFPRIAGQFVRIRPLGWHDGGTRVEIGELNVLGASFSGNYAPNGTIDSPIDNVTINVGGSVSFTGTYTDSNGDSPLSFLWDFGDSAIPDATIEDPGLITFSNPGTYTVTFTVTDPFGLSDPIPGTVVVKVLSGANSVLPRNDWAIEFVNSEEVILDSNAATNVFDGGTNTIWHSQWQDVEGPHEIQIDLGSAFAIDAFRYLPRSSGTNGRIDYYHIYVSPDGRDWGTPVAIGGFANNATEQRVQFSPKIGQFIRLVAITEVNGNRWASMAEANVEGVCQDPFVRIINPLTNEVQGRLDLTVTASVCLTQAAHAGWGVKFSVDSGAQEQTITLPVDGVIHPDTFQWTFAGLSGDNHQVEAFIVDDLGMPVAGNNTSDIVTNIGIGDVFAAIGDSITVGVGDDDNTDGTSQDGRNTNTGLGFIPVLNDILTNERGYPHNIHNDGISGDSSAGLLVRAAKILKSRKKTSAFLILIGSNDANSGLVPSGKGPNPPGPGTFKDNLQKIIDLLHNPVQGREVYLAKVPYTTNPASDPFILDYNIAIQELVTENSLPENVPDFYTHFLTNQLELQGDGLHPSGNGYKSMASLWCIEVSGGTCPIP